MSTQNGNSSNIVSQKRQYHPEPRLAAKNNSGYNNCAIRLVHSGVEFFDLLERLIDQSLSEIHLQFYIFSDDSVGTRIANALLKAARRGVEVYLLIDGFESRSLSENFLRKLSIPKLHLRRFEPLFRSKRFYVGRRLHHKLCVFDGQLALVGGINVDDQYLGDESAPPWLDFALYLNGHSVNELRDICISYWKDATGNVVSERLTRWYDDPLGSKSSYPCSVRVRRNDWIKNQNQIWKEYFEFFNQANESILIVCSYFLPGWIFLKQLKKAIARGVQVQVILAGISDVILAKHAERYLYRWMLNNGVQVYEYRRSVLHAKIAIKDHKWMTIGSYNVNNISALASIECNIEVRNKPYVSKVEHELLSIAATECDRITLENFNATQHPLKIFWRWTCYQLIKVILFLATFYFRREH